MQNNTQIKTTLIPKLRFKEFNENWIFGKISDFATFYNGKAFKQIELLDAGKYPVLRVGNLFTNNSWYYSDLELGENKYIDENDLIYAWSASFGPRVWKGKKVIYHYHIWKVVCNLSLVDKQFFYQILDNETAKMKANSSNGFALLHITKGTIENWKISIPNLQEQQKIATFLTSVDSKLQQLNKKKELLANYKKGVMQQLFSQQLRFKNDDGSDFPDWEFLRGNVLFKSISDKKHNSDLPILAITQDQGAIPRDMINYKMIVTEKSVASYKVVQVGDFIISLRSFQGGIEYTNYHGICSPAYNILRPSSENVHGEFYKVYLKTTFYIKQLQKKLEGIRDGKMISYKYFSEIKLPFPSLKEQQKIANYLSAIDKKIENVQTQIDKTQAFKKGLLQGMFV
jgi:type I restriction enzyme S subunit